MVTQEAQNFTVINKFSVRPSEGRGLWVFFLLPSSIVISSLTHPITTTTAYKISAVVGITVACCSVYIIVRCLRNEKIKVLNTWCSLISLLSCCVIHFWFHKGWLLSAITGTFSTITYLYTYIWLLVNIKESFTLGEAGLIAQGITLFLFSSLLNISNINSQIFLSNMQKSTAIIQVGLLGITALAFFMQKTKPKTSTAFYLATVLILSFTILLPLQVILQQSPLLWIFFQVIEDITLLKLFIYWSCCIGVAILAISNQIYYAKKASSSTRKIFHILAVIVYIPGLYYRCCFLYMASGVVLGIFFALEIIRLLHVPPLGNQLQDGYEVFRDEKDTGPLALTPIYLLVGVSLPIWLHPSPCDVTDSAQFTLLTLISGLATIGVGDTAASFVGSKFGRFKFKNSSKTIEGTGACIISQMMLFLSLFYVGWLPHLTTETILRIALSVIITSVIEAKTSQIDNLVLPLIMYNILI